jgi:hypothetical protein
MRNKIKTVSKSILRIKESYQEFYYLKLLQKNSLKIFNKEKKEKFQLNNKKNITKNIKLFDIL